MVNVVNIENSVDEYAKDLLDKILIARQPSVSKNEAEFRSKITPFIDEIAHKVGIDLHIREEYGLKFGLAYGRADAVYNRLVIEYEAPGSLRDNLEHSHTAHAVKQVKDYIEGLANRERHDLNRLAGIAFDGFFLIFVRWREGHWYIDPIEIVNISSITKFLRLLFSLTSGRALIPENLVDDFGSQNIYTQRSTNAFYSSLVNNNSELVDKLFLQWQSYFGQVTAYGESKEKLEQKEELHQFVRQIGLPEKDLDVPKFFFALHTQFSFLVKLVARLIIERYAAGIFGATPMSKLANLEGENFKAELRRFEDGDIFHSLGLRNLLEGDFFSWYLTIWSSDIESALKLTINRLAEYDPTTIENDPFAARDLLKKLYHYLLPKELRHDLGEYYTPDWLAERLFVQLGELIFKMPNEAKVRRIDPSKLNKRLLDPACGSGTFLILAIRALKEHCRRQQLGESATLNLILNNIVGIDLNPLAVTASRVNYLLAIADLIPYRQAEVEIPVYQADSILTPSSTEDLFGQGKKILKTVVGDLPVPNIVDTSEELNKLTDLLQECIMGDIPQSNFLERIKKSLSPSPQDLDIDILGDLYNKLLSLEKQNLDGIWAKVVKNAFMPLYIGKFDYIIGNPPWINWQSLPDEYRIDSSYLWKRYGLFVHSGMDTILGKGKKDLSTLMTYTVADRFLKDGGKLAFLITQSVFKTSAGQGFRRFKLGENGASLHIDQVDDLNELDPFEGASTKTTAFVIRKGIPTKYPVPYLYWKKVVRGKGLSYDSTLDEVLSITKRFNYQAVPVNLSDPTSIWLTGRPLAVKAIRKVLGGSNYEAHAGVYSGGANGVFWIEVLAKNPNGSVVIRNVTEGIKREVESVTTEIEPDLLFPLVKASDIARWKIDKPHMQILITQDPQKRRGIDIKEMMSKYPKTFLYLKRFEEDLKKRKSQAVRHLMENGLFYSMFSVSDYTFSPYKVIWPNIASDIKAVVVSSYAGKIVMPQHIVTLVGVNNLGEAYYITSLLNSLIIRFATLCYTQVGGKSFGTPHLLENLKIMKFNPREPLHIRLAKLSEDAHNVAKEDKQEELEMIEREINNTVMQLYDITDKEMAEITRNYQELYG